MSALIPYGSLISIGGAQLRTIGLTPQRISYSSTTRWPAHAVASGVHFQKTGADAERIIIEATTQPHVVGGLDAWAILKAVHRMQVIVPYIRLRGNYLGQPGGVVFIETLDADEEKIHPFDGVGRIVDVTIGITILPVAGGLLGGASGGMVGGAIAGLGDIVRSAAGVVNTIGGLRL